MSTVKYTPNMDTNPVEILDVMPENIIKVYPYELINAKEGVAFVAPQTVSVIAVSQKNMSGHQGMKQDMAGNWYFEAMPNMELISKLETSTNTSTMDKLFKEQVNFGLLSNTFYQSGAEKIFVGNTYFNPSVFTIGSPMQLEFVNNPSIKPAWYARDKYGSVFAVKDKAIIASLGKGVDGQMKDDKFANTSEQMKAKYIFFNEGGQEIYVASTTKAGKEYMDDESILNNNGIYETRFVNLSVIAGQYANALLKFTFNDKINHNTKNGLGHNGLAISYDSKMLINSVKAKGVKKVDLKNGQFKETDDLSEINLITEEPMTPFKATPISIKDKLTMYMDWFDYDTVLPYVFADEFRNNAKLSTIIKEKVDLELVEDMILLSYMFASEFDEIPVLTATGTDAGKLDPSYGLGHSQTAISKLAGKDPIKVIDSLFEKHIRKHPEFLTDHSRYQPTQGVINALCRYIASTHTIGKGGNAFGWAYLPWYLEPVGSIRIVNSPASPIQKEIKNLKILDPNMEFTIKSIYFTETYSTAKVNRSIDIPGKKLMIPNNVGLSGELLLQTDRKLTLPEVPYQIQPLNKLPLPGDINTKSSADLAYMWWLPISTNELMQKIMLKTTKAVSTIVPGTEFRIQIPPTKFGVTWTMTEVRNYLAHSGLYKGSTMTGAPPTITTDMSSIKTAHVSSNHLIINETGESVKIPPANDKVYTWQAVDTEALIAAAYHIDRKNIILVSDTVQSKQSCKWVDDQYTQHKRNWVCELSTKGNVNFKLKRSVFTSNMMVSTAVITKDSFSFNERQVMFDKLSWEEFLLKFGIISSTKTHINLKTEFDSGIEKLSEIILTSIFGDEILLHTGNSPRDTISIPLFSKTDETISTQKIIFT